MPKKLLAALLCIALIFLCGSCSAVNRDEAVLNVSGAEIDREIFAYYFDKVVSNPENYSLKKDASASQKADKAVELCVRYVTVNTMFRKYNLQLTSALKTEISQNVGTLWTCYGNHYKKIGVSRATISKIQTNVTYENTIFTALFDNSDEESEKKVKKYFAENYIIFRAVSGYFTTTDAAGSAIDMNDAQKNAMEAQFKLLASNIKDISGLESATAELGYTPSSTILLKKNQADGYPKGFFEKVSALENGKASVLRFDDCIFIIWKYDPAEREQEYASCRSQCVKDMYSAFGEASYKSIEDSLTVKRNESEIGSFIKNINLYG